MKEFIKIEMKGAKYKFNRTYEQNRRSLKSKQWPRRQTYNNNNNKR